MNKNSRGFARYHSISGFARYRLVLGFAPVLIVVILGLVAMVGYLVLKPTIPSSEPTPSTPSEESTANWKTYGNEKAGYEFKYPKDWLLGPFTQNCNFNPNPNYPENIIISNYCIPSDPLRQIDGDGVRIDIDSETYRSQSVDEFEKLLNYYNKVYMSQPGVKHFEDISTTIDGKTAIKRKKVLNLEGKDYTHNFLFVDLGNKAYIFTYNLQENNIIYENTIDQILSTFKFLEE